MKLKLARTHARSGPIFTIARLGKQCEFAGADGVVAVADLDVEKPTFAEIGNHGAYITGLAVVGGTVVTIGYDGRLVWWDAEAKKPIRDVEAHGKWGRGLIATPDGSRLISIADDMLVKVWDAANGTELATLRGHAAMTPHDFPSMLYALAVSPDGLHLASGDKVGRVNVWELATGKNVATLDASSLYTWDPTARRHSIGGVRSLSFACDRLLVGGVGKISNVDHLDGKPRVEAFDWPTGKRTHEIVLDQFKGLVNKLLPHPSGATVALGGANDGFLAVLDAQSKVVTAEKVPAHAHSAAWNEAGDRLYIAGHAKLFAYEVEPKPKPNADHG